MSEEHDEKEVTVELPVVWQSSDDLPTVYASQLFITHAGGEFYLVFGELAIPMITTPDKLPESIAILPVAKIAVTAENIVRFAGALNTNIEKYLSRQGGGE
jgi:hypothetical protein